VRPPWTAIGVPVEVIMRSADADGVSYTLFKGVGMKRP
jgi:hypothetical protein